MHIVDIFGRIFISALFLIEAVRKFFDPDISMNNFFEKLCNNWWFINYNFE